MKNKDQNNKPINSNFFSERNFEVDQFKTTNVNVLLNRVKLDKKKTLKKKIIFVITLFVGISLLAAFFIN